MAKAKTAADVYALLADDLPILKSQMIDIKMGVAQNNRALRGSNSDPGLVADVSSLCTTQESMDGRIGKIETCLHEGVDDVPGLVEQVRQNRLFRKNLKYWYVLLIGAIVVNVVGIAFQLLSRNFFPLIP